MTQERDEHEWCDNSPLIGRAGRVVIVPPRLLALLKGAPALT
jgi:hypothetical protein